MNNTPVGLQFQFKAKLAGEIFHNLKGVGLHKGCELFSVIIIITTLFRCQVL